MARNYELTGDLTVEQATAGPGEKRRAKRAKNVDGWKRLAAWSGCDFYRFGPTGVIHQCVKPLGHEGEHASINGE